MPPHFDPDVFIAGAGPAGLAAAIAASSQGLRVTAADGAVPPIEKACGEGLLPESVAAAAALGVKFPEQESFRFRGIRFLSHGCRVHADFRSGYGLGVRRGVLQQALIDRACATGVEIHWGTPVMDFENLSARWIVGADGERSRVRAWAGLDAPHRPRARFGFRRHYRVSLWTDYMEVYWGAGLQCYVTPVAPDEICVAAVSRDSHTRLDDALEQFPGLREKLGRAEVLSAERGSVTAMRRLPLVCRGNVALVGDASGSVDAITGAGIGLAFRQAAALAEAIGSGDLDRYQAAHRRIMRRTRWMAELLLAMDRWQSGGNGARRVLSAWPGLFERLLAVHA